MTLSPSLFAEIRSATSASRSRNAGMTWSTFPMAILTSTRSFFIGR